MNQEFSNHNTLSELNILNKATDDVFGDINYEAHIIPIAQFPEDQAFENEKYSNILDFQAESQEDISNIKEEKRIINEIDIGKSIKNERNLYRQDEDSDHPENNQYQQFIFMPLQIMEDRTLSHSIKICKDLHLKALNSFLKSINLYEIGNKPS